MTAPPRDNPGVIVPPPLIPLAVLGLGFVLDWWFLRLGFLFEIEHSLRILIGAFLGSVGLILEFLANRVFEKAGTNVPPWKPALHLATGGIYRYVRNPMYVGLAPITAGIAIAMASEWSLVLMVPAALLIHYGVVLREERYLEAKFGDAYRCYKEQVPRYGLPWARAPRLS